MKNILTKTVTIFIVMFMSLNVIAQGIPMDVNNISDQQLTQILTKYQLSGLSDAEFESIAKQKGLSSDQIDILKKRMALLDPLSNKSSLNFKSKTADDITADRAKIETKKPTTIVQNVIDKPILNVFGAELFSNEGLSFEPNLNIATPKNYVIGVGDELNIDIYGLSESTKKLKVNAEGFIRFPNLGPIKVVGLTIEEAQIKIKAQAAKIYTTIASGNTNVTVSVGQLRSIRVTLVGEVKKPGNYTVSSLATIMNALYASGGPNTIGSFRKIELVRSGKTIVIFDLYDFLLKGDLSKNRILQDEDVIRVGPYETRVAVLGASKKQALFDVKKGESAYDILNFAGGFSDLGYKEMIRIKRNGIKGREVITVKSNQLNQFPLYSGDTLLIDALPSNYVNRISINGAVYFAGEYGLDQFKTLKDLLLTAQVKENAFFDRAVIRRLNKDLTPQIINFKLNDVLNGKEDISLIKEDSIYIYAKEAIREKYTVVINGEVNTPDTYTYADSMHVQDLILMAGGFKDGASLQRIEVARRLRENNSGKDTAIYSVIKEIDLSNLNQTNEALNFVLAPFDVVSVRKSPMYKEQITVDVQGEVLFPGKYTLAGNKERLSDIIIRAGGLKLSAYSKGSMLLRKSPLNVFKPVGIKLNEVLLHPGIPEDIILEQGDSVHVPKFVQTVQTTGAVNVPRQVSYEPGMTFLNVIRKSGWFVSNANRRHAYVVSANGEIKTTKRFLIFHFYPKVEPGAEIVIPAKKPKLPVTTAEYIGIGSSIASLAGLIIALINATK
jgi:protein involved in polysaccharide export with SLBB domain